MDNSELLDKLKALGVLGSDWKGFGEKELENPFIKRFKPLLEQLVFLLESQVETKISEVQKLRELLSRNEHGGGS